MKFSTRFCLATLCSSLLVASWSPAGDAPSPAPSTISSPAPVADADLPQPVDPSTAENLLANPAFTRQLDWSQSLQLTGVAYIEGKPVATIFDRAAKKNYVVSAEPNAQGWKLQDASAARKMARTEVKIVVGGEVVTVRYADQQLAPEAVKSRRRDAGPETITTPDGQTFVRSSHYMSDDQREKYYSLPRESRDKWREIMRTNNARLLNAPAEERESFVKKSFDDFQKNLPAAPAK